MLGKASTLHRSQATEEGHDATPPGPSRELQRKGLNDDWLKISMAYCGLLDEVMIWDYYMWDYYMWDYYILLHIISDYHGFLWVIMDNHG